MGALCGLREGSMVNRVQSYRNGWNAVIKEYPLWMKLEKITILHILSIAAIAKTINNARLAKEDMD